MKNATTLFLGSLLALTTAACGGGGGGGGSGGTAGGSGGNTAGNGGSGGGGGGAVTCLGTSIKPADANNYQFTSTLTFPPITVAPRTELSFDWSAVTQDFLGHSLNAKTDLNLIQVMSWNLPLGDLESKLNADTLLQKDLTVVPLSLHTDGSTPGVAAGATSAKLFSFTLNGGAISPDGGSITPERVLDYFDADNYAPDKTTYTLMVATGDVLGQGVKIIQSFLLDKGSTNDKVTMTSASTTLTYTANLHNLTAMGVPAGQAAITVDWSTGMSKNALGNTFEPTSITHALVGRYSETPSQLETKFLDIELIAAELYQADINIGTKVDLSTLKTSSGTSFSGISSSGTWILALQCGSCRNPAPWFLTVLQPCQ